MRAGGNDEGYPVRTVAQQRSMARPVERQRRRDETSWNLVGQSARGKVLAYCRSGTRSTLLWALAAASKGADPEAITQAAAAAGYDVSPVRGAMQELAARTAG